MDAQVENHLPLITPRLIFAPQNFPAPPTITPRMEFPSLNIEARDDSPAPESGARLHRAGSPPNHAVPSSTVPRRAGTPRAPTLVTSNTATRRAETPRALRFASTASPRRAGTPEDMEMSPTEQHQRSISISSSTEDEEMGPSETEGEVVGNKIKKPKGDVSRIGRGGYNLHDKLGWNQRTYDNVLALVSKLAKEMLDTSQSYRGQSRKKVQSLMDLVRKEHEFMKDYEDDWPVRDMLKTYLKNSSQTARNAKGKEVAKEIGKIVRQANAIASTSAR
ncbi:hypothetical protein GALMADRAFT_136361 [Galerina marginata CBS 339.88]|uniref:Uncharacterized protein n=1 Tax=Galerina marginata (strain CBS 339.88) TaxID=685588 RepID=A0A067T962_GALM3|nr:hypothetical protein GALMADRAFT_136361 [Galerina marginata CBS 339.88]